MLGLCDTSHSPLFGQSGLQTWEVSHFWEISSFLKMNKDYLIMITDRRMDFPCGILFVFDCTNLNHVMIVSQSVNQSLSARWLLSFPPSDWNDLINQIWNKDPLTITFKPQHPLLHKVSRYSLPCITIWIQKPKWNTKIKSTDCFHILTV